jgi:hypothetical protein
MIHLGDKVKDTVTGLTGTAVARTEWLNGCVRVTIQPTVKKKDGSVPEAYTTDEPQVVVVQSKAKKRGSDKTGGPLGIKPQQHAGPSR